MPELASYKEYQAPGMPGIELVPRHWNIRCLGQVGTLAKGTGGNKDDERPEGLPCVRYGDLYTTHRFFIEGTRSFITQEASSNYTKIRLGDVLFAGSGETTEEIGKSAVNLIEGPAYCGGDVILFRPTEGLDPKYCGYVLDCRPMADQKAAMGRGFTVYHIYGRQLKYLQFPVPPPQEQAAIVRFLDHADEQIQRYIAGKERLIALLEEKRQALVHQAVTQGLDPNVRLRPSGFEGAGHVPEHWELCRLRNVVSVVTTGSRGWSSYASETGPLFIRIANLNRGSLRLRFENIVRLNLPKTSEAGRARIRAGDLLVSVTAYIGSVGVAPKGFEEAYVSQHVARCQPIPGLDSEWLGYVLLSKVGQAHGQISLYGGTKDGLSLDDVKNYPMLLPPPSEQAAIVEYVNTVSADIEVPANQARRQIDLVNEYRTRLIADVVTGQLDVRELGKGNR